MARRLSFFVLGSIATSALVATSDAPAQLTPVKPGTVQPVPTVIKTAPLPTLTPPPATTPLPARTIPPPPPPPPPAVGPAPTPATPVIPPQAAVPIQIGTAIEDITGPAADIGMMGYGNSSQKTTGIHMRLWARAFVFANPTTGKRVAFVSAELGQLFSSVKQGVLKKLATRLPGVYSDANLQIAATHTHAGPGGYSHHALYNLTTMGFIPESYWPIVDGITEAVVRAHNGATPGTLKIATGPLTGASLNRSDIAYRRNPGAVVDPPGTSPTQAGNVNRLMTVLRIDRPTGAPAGAISWFSVHNTSLTQGNTLISSDNKGLAAYLFEKAHGSVAPFENKGAFVAAFPNSDEGDVSPNTGPNFTGPNNDEYVSAELIGRAQSQKAQSLFDTATMNLGGEVDFKHRFVTMPGYAVTKTTHKNGAGGNTLCKAAMGMSFAAGAEDGRSGNPGFTEGMTSAQWNANMATLVQSWSAGQDPTIRAAITAAFPQVAHFQDPCQVPKPVLLPTGSLVGFTPATLPFQILRVGNLAILGVPSEMTTMAGWRLRNAVETKLRYAGITNIVITGLANEYSGYVTTPEEYDSQQYEGASTLYGRLTLDAYIEIFTDLADAILMKRAVDPGPTPPDLLPAQISTQLPVVYDDKRLVEQFGQVMNPGLTQRSVATGASIRAIFRGAIPRNNLRTNDTMFAVEKSVNGGWVRVAWDAMPETRFSWWRDTAADCKACSFAQAYWFVPQNAPSGRYRFRYFGTAMVFAKGKVPFEGTWEFDVR